MKRFLVASLVLLSVLCTLGAAALVLGTVTNGGVAHAYVPERPTVEKVRVFSCNYTYDGDKCSAVLEERANQYLATSPGRIVSRQVVATKDYVTLFIFTEELERPTARKLPAEAPR